MEAQRKSPLRWPKVTTIVSISALIPTAAVPVLYLLGLLSDEGSLAVYGIATELAPKTVPEYLVSAFYALLRMIKSWIVGALGWSALYAVAVFVALLFIALLDSLFKRLPEEKVNASVQKLTKHRFASILKIPSLSAVSTLALLLFFSVFLILTFQFLKAFYRSGQEAAREDLQSYQKEPCIKGKSELHGCVFISKAGKVIAAGRVITRSSTHLAIYDGASVKMIPITDEVIETIPEQVK